MGAVRPAAARPTRPRYLAIWRLGAAIALAMCLGQPPAAGLASNCERPGWFPVAFGLKDHTVFYYQGDYYIASISFSAQHQEDRFAYARSADLCNWEELAPVLSERVPGTDDEHQIWAPYVYEEGGVYYMFYTGVTRDITQRIMLATSTDPADPAAWQKHGAVFQPDHPGMIWQAGAWADCRDATILKSGGIYYLYYTGEDVAGGIVGVATATSLLGPWHDWGSVLTLSPGADPESPMVVQANGLYYLFYNDTQQQAEYYRIGASPTGPWTPARPLVPGWAHEVWLSPAGEWYTSFLTDYTVTISRLTWDTLHNLPRPFIGGQVYHLWLPQIAH